MSRATPHTDPNAGPEPLKELHDELRKLVVDIMAASEAGDADLHNELQAKHVDLFQRCREEAKQFSAKPKEASSEEPPTKIPESVQAIQAEVKEVAAAYNKAVEEENHERATQLRAKLNELREASAAEAKNHSLAVDWVRIWCEVHNMGPSQVLENAGGWDVEHGWFESGKAGNYRPGEVCYMHTGGAAFSGIDMKAYWRWSDNQGVRPACRWWSKYEGLSDSLHAEEWGNNCYHTWDGGYTVRFYFTHP